MRSMLKIINNKYHNRNLEGIPTWTIQGGAGPREVSKRMGRGVVASAMVNPDSKACNLEFNICRIKMLKL